MIKMERTVKIDKAKKFADHFNVNSLYDYDESGENVAGNYIKIERDEMFNFFLQNKWFVLPAETIPDSAMQLIATKEFTNAIGALKTVGKSRYYLTAGNKPFYVMSGKNPYSDDGHRHWFILNAESLAAFSDYNGKARIANTISATGKKIRLAHKVSKALALPAPVQNTVSKIGVDFGIRSTKILGILEDINQDLQEYQS